MGKLVPLICLLLLTLACDRYAPVENEMPTESTSDTTFSNSTSQTFTNSTSNQTFDNSTSHQTFSNITTTPGTIKKIIAYPAGIVGVSDLVYDNPGLWLLAERGSTSGSTLELIKVDKESGQTLQTIPLINPPFSLNHASEMAWNGEFFWMTSYGWSNGIPQSYIYKVDLTGNLVATIPCPSTNTGGFCEGLAWDGIYLWTGASDNKNIVQFSTDGVGIKTLNNVFSSIGVGDVSLKDTSHLIISHTNYLYLIDTASMAITGQLYTSYSKKGDWDSQLFWFANNSTQQLEGIYTGF